MGFLRLFRVFWYIGLSIKPLWDKVFYFLTENKWTKKTRSKIMDVTIS